MEHRLINFSEKTETIQVAGKKPDDKKKTERQPITAQTVRDDVQKLIERLQYLEQRLAKDIVKKLRQKLEGIQKRYQKIDQKNLKALQTLKAEIYADCAPLLQQSAKEQLAKYRNIRNAEIKGASLTFSLRGETMTAELSNLYKVRSLKLLNTTVTFARPVRLDALDEYVGYNALAALGRAAKQFDLRKLTIKASEARFEFTAKYKGKDQKFVATAQDLLRVTKEASAEKKQQLVQARKAIAKAETGIRAMMPKLKTMGMEKQMMQKLEGEKVTGVKAFKPKQKAQWKAFLTLIEQYKVVAQREGALAKECQTRELMTTGGTKVLERGGSQMPTSFDWVYLGANNKPKAKLSWVFGKVSSKVEYEGQKRRYQTEYYDSGEPQIKRDFRRGVLHHYSPSGQKLYRKTFDPKQPDTILETQMYGGDGSLLSTLDRERKKRPKLTDNQYLDMLAKKLDTPEKLGLYMELFMQYTFDSDDPKQPFKKGTIDTKGEYWQTPEQTICRLEGGKMLGDCDDYSILAREILRRQNKHPHVCIVDGHATCVWVEKRKDGRYDGYSVGTFGLYKNGFTGTQTNLDAAKKGFKTIEAALTSVLKKFTPVQSGTQIIQLGKPLPFDVRKYGVLGMERGPKQEHIYGPLSFEAFANREIGDQALLVMRYIETDKIPLAAATAAALLKNFPKSPTAQALQAVFLYPKNPAAADALFKRALKQEGTEIFVYTLHKTFAKNAKRKGRERLYSGANIVLMEMMLGRMVSLKNSYDEGGDDLVEAYEKTPKQQKRHITAAKAILKRGTLAGAIVTFLATSYETGKPTPQRKRERMAFFRGIEKDFLEKRTGKLLSEDEINFLLRVYEDGMKDRPKMIDIYQKQIRLAKQDWQKTTDNTPERTKARAVWIEQIDSLLLEQHFANRLKESQRNFATWEKVLSPQELYSVLPIITGRRTYQPELADMYERTFKRLPTVPPEKYATLGEYFRRGKQYEKALKHCFAALKAGRNTVVETLVKIQPHVSKERWQQVAKVLHTQLDQNAAKERKAKFVDSKLYFIAEGYRLLKQPTKAVTLYKQRIAIRKTLYDKAKHKEFAKMDYFDAQEGLVDLYRRLGRKKDALALCQTMLKIFPERKERIENAIKFIKEEK